MTTAVRPAISPRRSTTRRCALAGAFQTTDSIDARHAPRTGRFRFGPSARHLQVLTTSPSRRDAPALLSSLLAFVAVGLRHHVRWHHAHAALHTQHAHTGAHADRSILSTKPSQSPAVTMVEPGKQVALENPPQDGISALSFAPSSSNLLLVSSWDKVRPCVCVCLLPAALGPPSVDATQRISSSHVCVVPQFPTPPNHPTEPDGAPLRRRAERGQGHLAEPRGGDGLRRAGRPDGLLRGAGPGRAHVSSLRGFRSCVSRASGIISYGWPQT